MINDTDIKHLQRCIELARIALEVGDEPSAPSWSQQMERSWPKTVTM